MEYYIELKVRLRQGQWYDHLMQALEPFYVRWQNGFYHITMAFMNDMSAADVGRLSAALGELLADRAACNETFGRVGAFTAQSGKEHIVYLVPKVVSETLDTLVADVRQCCTDKGIAISPDYRHHITLGRIDIGAVDLDRLQALTNTIHMPDFELRLDNVRLVRRIDHHAVGAWILR